MADYPTTLEEMEAAFPQVAVETLQNALRDLRQGARDVSDGAASDGATESTAFGDDG